MAERRAAWDGAAGAAVAAFRRGASLVAFATIGDPNVYSTFTYLAATVRPRVPGLTVATVPGITAMQDLAARSGTVLCEGTETLALLQAGNLFGIYPEGTRSHDGRLYRGRPGVGWLALKSGLPVIPVGMVGTRRVLPPGSVVPRPGRIEIRIGAPLVIPTETLQVPQGKARQMINEPVINEIQKMTGQEYVHMFASDRKAELAAAEPPKPKRRFSR